MIEDGFVIEDNVIPSFKKEGVVLTKSLNVRDEPSIEGSKIISTIGGGQQVEIEAEIDDWYLINKPIEGYCMKEYIRIL